MKSYLRITFRKFFKVAFYLGWLLAAAGIKTTQAQELAGKTIHDLAAYGYVLMDDINTPLLHHVATGAPYDSRVLAATAITLGPDSPSRNVQINANSRNEFERADATAEWESFIQGRVQRLKNAQGYVILLDTNWGEFDFVTSRFPVELKMVRQAWRSNSTFHCVGAHNMENYRYGRDFRTACMTAANLNSKTPFLQYFPLLDLGLARAIKGNPYQYEIYALAEPAGKYQLTRGREIQYVPLETYVASGIQPVKITGLVLTMRQGQKILSISRMNNEPLGAPARQAGNANGAMHSVAEPAQKAAVTARATASASADWKMVAQSSDATFYVDPSSIKREGSVVLIRQMFDSSEPDAKGRRSVVEIFSYDCNKRTTRLVSMKGYSQPLGTGGVLSDLATPRFLDAIKPGSIGEVQFNFACNAPVPKN